MATVSKPHGATDIIRQATTFDVEIMPETTVDVMKCLSIRQPYADWIVHPERFLEYGIKPKKIENRDWKTQYRGPVLLHASKSFEKDAFSHYARRIEHFAKAVSLTQTITSKVPLLAWQI